MAKLVEKIVPTWVAEEGDEYIPVYDPTIDGESIELIRCKDCKHAVLTTSGEAKYCKWWQGEEDGTYGGDQLYLDGNFYCAVGERR